ncbi:unnamed protein product [Gulo gulo]|uniref:Uncharacterized protein n=1 Tax=Gulo gulo TaxID=48420 RepID=A0A9X9Q0G4_GULGU|nr:unnamed protein product [Gulo gulo]
MEARPRPPAPDTTSASSSTTTPGHQGGPTSAPSSASSSTTTAGHHGSSSSTTAPGHHAPLTVARNLPRPPTAALLPSLSGSPSSCCPFPLRTVSLTLLWKIPALATTRSCRETFPSCFGRFIRRKIFWASLISNSEQDRWWSNRPWPSERAPLMPAACRHSWKRTKKNLPDITCPSQMSGHKMCRSFPPASPGLGYLAGALLCWCWSVSWWHSPSPMSLL